MRHQTDHDSDNSKNLWLQFTAECSVMSEGKQRNSLSRIREYES